MKLYGDVFGNHTAVPLCLCAGKGNRFITELKKREVQNGRRGIFEEKRETVQVKSSENYEIFMIIYDILMSEVTADFLFPVRFL